MAVRFSADAEDYTRTLGLGVQAQFSLTCWLRLATDRNDFSTAWCIDSGANTDYAYLQTNSSGVEMSFYQNGTSNLGTRTLTPGTWYWWGVAVNANNVTVLSRAVGDSSFTATTTATGDSTGTNTAVLRLGESIYGAEWLDGSLAAVKLWTGVTLSRAELEAEAFQYLPARTSGLRAWYPFLRADTVDYSGNGNTLAGGSGTSTEDGPPIRWGGGRARIILPDDTVAGVLEATLPALGASAAGAVTVAGHLAATLPALDGQAAGRATVAGQLGAALPALTGALTGTTTTPALLAAVLPPLQASFEGLLSGGFLVAQLPAVTGSLGGRVRVAGQVDAVLPPLSSDLAGHADIPHNDLAVTVGAPYRGWASRGATAAWRAATADTVWTARRPAVAWAAETPVRGWRTRQPTT